DQIVSLEEKIEQLVTENHELDKIKAEKQNLLEKIDELEDNLETKDLIIRAKSEEIKQLTKHTDNIESGVSLYQGTIVELKAELRKQKKYSKELIAKKEAVLGIISEQLKDSADQLEKKEKIIASKDKTIKILQKEISNLNIQIQTSGTSITKKELASDGLADSSVNNILENLKKKLTTDELNKLILAYQELETKISYSGSYNEKQREKLERLIAESEKDQLTMKKLTSEKDFEKAISRIETAKDSVARVMEMNKLRDRIKILEKRLETRKKQYDDLQKEYSQTIRSAISKKILHQKQAYESRIRDLETKLNNLQYQLEESKRRDAEQQNQIQGLNLIIERMNIDEPKPILSDKGLLISSKLDQNEETELIETQTNLPSKEYDEEGLLINLPLTPLERIERERDTQLREFFTELTYQFKDIRDIVLVGFNGNIHFETSLLNIKKDILKLIQDWKTNTTSVWINGMKYVSVKNSSEILAATNVQGKGHLLCAVLDDNIFIICFIDILGDALVLYEDLKHLLPSLKTIYNEFEKRKTEIQLKEKLTPPEEETTIPPEEEITIPPEEEITIPPEEEITPPEEEITPPKEEITSPEKETLQTRRKKAYPKAKKTLLKAKKT
ncbi:MAG: hypothetical protein ACFFD2_12895, partial [Promethearchaeota archaeon]